MVDGLVTMLGKKELPLSTPKDAAWSMEAS